jgi:hypothetical protein
MTEVRLSIPLRTPTANQLSGYHWRKRHRMKRDWQWLVVAAMGWAGVGKQRGRYDVTIERHAARALDPDNAVGGCKVVLDGMVAAGLLVDDSLAYVASLTVVQIASTKKEERTVIRLRPAPPGSSSATSAPATPGHSPG